MPRFLRPFPIRRVWCLAALLPLFTALAGCQLWPPHIYKHIEFAPDAPQTRVFMIGDSLTYYHDLPGLLQQFSVNEPRPINIEQCTTAYTSLSVHWSAGSSVNNIRNNHFDYVILQDFSRKPVTNPDGALNSFVKYDQEIRKAGGGGGKTILFQNWTRRGHQDDYPALLNTYNTVVRQTGATLAPIGAAWKLCAAERPDIRLLADDRHPTKAGTYLAACVLYDVIYQKRSTDLPATLQAPDLSPSVLTALRSIADRAVYASTP